MIKKRKRFIAGAVCPRCGGLDTIFLLDLDQQKSRSIECVNCDFQEDQPTAEMDKADWQPVRIAEPTPKTESDDEPSS